MTTATNTVPIMNVISLFVWETITIFEWYAGQLRPIFNDEEIAGIAEYGKVLRDIRARLLAEGYFLEDGKTWDTSKVAIPFPVTLEGDD